MDTISYLNMTVNGFSFRKITYLFISHEPNQHAYAKIIGEVDADTAQDSHRNFFAAASLRHLLRRTMPTAS